MSALKKTFVPVGVVGPPCSSALPLRSPDTTRRMGLSAPSGMLPDLRARQTPLAAAGATDPVSPRLPVQPHPSPAGARPRQPCMTKKLNVSGYRQHLPGPRLGSIPSIARCPPASAAQAHTTSLQTSRVTKHSAAWSRGATDGTRMDGLDVA